MMAALMLLVQAMVPAGQVTTPSAAVAAPAGDWSDLPAMPWRAAPRTDAAVSQFVAGEVKAGRCVADHDRTGAILRLDVAVLADPTGKVRTIVPRAIRCPTVEQYASGLVSRWARDNLSPTSATAPVWYKATLTFSWAE